MILTEQMKLPRITIHPGENYVTKKNEVISTLLGSCIAACLYDPINRVIGMNHFLLAEQKNSKISSILESDEGRYGIQAMELLINKMLKQGAQRVLLQAKVFGGGDVIRMRNHIRGIKSVGASNCEFIKTFLKTEGIPIQAADLGGNNGRSIHFVATDFSVYVKSIDTAHKQFIINEEQQLLDRKHKQTLSASFISKADFW